MRVEIPQVEARPLEIVVLASAEELRALGSGSRSVLRARQVEISGQQVDDILLDLRVSSSRSGSCGRSRTQRGHRGRRW